MLRRIVTAGWRMRGLQGASLFGLVAAVGACISGCATLERLPAVTYAQAKQADILDIPDARFYVAETKQILDVAVKANQRRNLARGVSATRRFGPWDS